MSLIELGELEANEQIPRIGDLKLAILPEREHREHLHLHLHLRLLNLVRIPRIGDLELAILPEHCEHHSRNLSHQLAD